MSANTISSRPYTGAQSTSNAQTNIESISLGDFASMLGTMEPSALKQHLQNAYSLQAVQNWSQSPYQFRDFTTAQSYNRGNVAAFLQEHGIEPLRTYFRNNSYMLSLCRQLERSYDSRTPAPHSFANQQVLYRAYFDNAQRESSQGIQNLQLQDLVPMLGAMRSDALIPILRGAYGNTIVDNWGEDPNTFRDFRWSSNFQLANVFAFLGEHRIDRLRAFLSLHPDLLPTLRAAQRAYATSSHPAFSEQMHAYEAAFTRAHAPRICGLSLEDWGDYLSDVNPRTLSQTLAAMGMTEPEIYNAWTSYLNQRNIPLVYRDNFFIHRHTDPRRFRENIHEFLATPHGANAINAMLAALKRNGIDPHEFARTIMDRSNHRPEPAPRQYSSYDDVRTMDWAYLLGASDSKGIANILEQFFGRQTVTNWSASPYEFRDFRRSSQFQRANLEAFLKQHGVEPIVQFCRRSYTSLEQMQREFTILTRDADRVYESNTRPPLMSAQNRAYQAGLAKALSSDPKLKHNNPPRNFEKIDTKHLNSLYWNDIKKACTDSSKKYSMLKGAAITLVVAFTVIAVAALIATWFFAPLFALPIVAAGALLLMIPTIIGHHLIMKKANENKKALESNEAMLTELKKLNTLTEDEFIAKYKHLFNLGKVATPELQKVIADKGIDFYKPIIARLNYFINETNRLKEKLVQLEKTHNDNRVKIESSKKSESSKKKDLAALEKKFLKEKYTARKDYAQCKLYTTFIIAVLQDPAQMKDRRFEKVCSYNKMINSFPYPKDQMLPIFDLNVNFATLNNKTGLLLKEIENASIHKLKEDILGY